jgi:hypothetical protein
MPKEKINAPLMQLVDFLNTLPELAVGKVEFIGAFDYWMEHVKGVTQATEEEFSKHLENFRKGV